METIYLGTFTAKRRLTKTEIQARMYHDAVRRLRRKLLFKQFLMSTALFIMGILIPSEASFFIVPLGMYGIAAVIMDDIIIVGGPNDYVDPDDYFIDD